ncbi:MAG: type II secretion system ATPase GspE [Candidatus Polarisedimenticolaceae bacterium]|nr:type II secretion system ATPase GspE [Candidatus Polarisedimenticolaceae bacterium]
MAKRIGELLVELNLLDETSLERALHAQKAHDERLGTILTKLGLISDEDRALALSKQLALPLIYEDAYPSKPLLTDTVSLPFLKEAKVVPLGDTDNGFELAMADPLDQYAIDAMALLVNKPILPFVALERDIDSALERLYSSGESSFDEIIEDVGGNHLYDDNEDIERLKDMASEAPIIRLVNLIISRAYESNASDIHIEPSESRLRVRYRIDGVLRETDSPPAKLAAAIISRIKIMAHLNIAERRLAQDGRIRLSIHDHDVDMRISTVPTINSESVVMRLLEHTAIELDFSALGFSSQMEASVKAALDNRHGILLVTGPTGSGKTTSLYTALNHLNSTERKIITVEDPVEYQIEGITQIQTKTDIGLTFATILRSIVRQDPDIIMIGEMRDLETAEIAIQSALTGHLVLSTLHTNDAAGAVTRLLDMGVEDYLLTSTISGILAQRLVRILCKECRSPYTAPQELINHLHLNDYADEKEITLYRAEGCEVCNQRGYIGRIGILEFLEMNETIRQQILKHSDTATLQKIATRMGMTTLTEDGIRKALAGITTIEEVTRVTKSH